MPVRAIKAPHGERRRVGANPVCKDAMLKSRFEGQCYRMLLLMVALFRFASGGAPR